MIRHGLLSAHSFDNLRQLRGPMAETVSQLSERGSYEQFLDRFRQTIEDASLRLKEISAEQSSHSSPGDWSCKEILGHLIDSATNNHQRFVRAQFSEDLVFPGYEQEQWVSAQKYNEASWPSLIEFWRAYNLHLLHVVSVIPRQVLTQPRTKHSLDRIAFNTVDPTTPATLEYLIRDYLDHLQHHLDQIWREIWPTPTKS